MSVAKDDDGVAVIAQVFGEEQDEQKPKKITAKFEFDEDFQKRIAALAIRHPRFARRTEGLIEPDYFDAEEHSFLVDAANRYFRQYRTLPDSPAIFAHFLRKRMMEARVRKDFKESVVKEYKSLITENLADGDYIADEIGRFAKHQALQNAMLASVDMIEKGDLQGVENIMNKAMRVGAAEDLEEIDFWNDIDRRTQYRKDLLNGKIEKFGVPTGLSRLDAMLYHEGWGRKELTVIMAGAKKGKSMTLGHFSILGSLHGHNTLYVTCEVSNDIIADRMDANISKISMNELKNRYEEASSVVSTKSAATRGELRLVEAPSGSLSPSGLRRIIERHKADGITFDIIVVDYADIMRPDVVTTNDIENSKQVWLGLRAIAFEESAAVLTATQTNREGFKSDTAKAEHAAEDFNKIRIADLVISLNRTDDEKDKNKARLYFAASRNQAGEFTLNIEQNLESAQAITKITGVS